LKNLLIHDLENVRVESRVVKRESIQA